MQKERAAYQQQGRAKKNAEPVSLKQKSTCPFLGPMLNCR
jgi:hypothetical protein